MSGAAAGFDAAAVADEIEAELAAAGTPDRAVHEKAYLKSDLDFLGASVPTIRAAATAVHRQHPDLGHDEVVALVTALWDTPVHERRMAAVEVLDLYGAVLGPDDVDLLERLLRESRTWALVDGLAASVVGALAERFPDDLDPVVRGWATDDDRWVRRSALLAHLVALRRGEGDFTRFGELADPMLEDTEFFIRKAIGWVLRDTGRRRPELVADWLAPRAARASGLTVREAVKHLPDDQRRRIDQARAAAGGTDRGRR